jgi:hypothetical protein
MINMQESNMFAKSFQEGSSKVLHDNLSRYATLTLSALAFLGLILYGPETFALNDQDRLAELATLTTEVGKLTKTGCYIAGGVSSLVGLAWSIAAQNLKILAASAVITVFAFKAPALFTSTMLI